ncbi:GNAT superfamily N-acetyltransferase [Metabacillus crassostreae]|uniref:GNAT family N-acetyltransferase n=1 Tax=Metabacillus crassostreae TaxID=929098 RepID=UPI00195DE220|nr:GNAT family N-acetyltransferase [Metabacillus crassostreae]MBM7602905.1 GNAT superfamily N-acetyltransferase [Metabacillus crassostreae]
MEIRKVKKEEIQQVGQFLEETMGAVFPFPLSEASKRDITEMEELYLTKEKTTLLAAFKNGKVVGTIGVRPYDDRIASIKGRYELETTCEIIKCYVDQNLRRAGIGSELFSSIEQYCQEAGYKTLYLHTQKFLPGGYSFWQKKEFSMVLDEQDEFETVHFEKVVF